MSPDDPAKNAELRDKLSLSFPILSDPEMTVTDLYGVRHVGAAGPRDLPYPTTFVIDVDGVVRQRFDNETYRQRPESADVLAAIRALGPSAPS